MTRCHLDIVPDLVIEVVSPSDRPQEVADKIAFYHQHGVPLAWAVYPRTRTVVAHRQGQEPQTFGVGDVLAADDIMPGFRLPVADIFS
jgi:Uma2 family endonuclease